MYKPKQKNIIKLKAYLDKKDERDSNTKRRCTRAK
tara:strand:+ start:273 stop:377 length:105 start_codon:yes stop_codon:yes gene_type:complete